MALLVINGLTFCFVEQSLFLYLILIASLVVFGIILNFFRYAKRIFPDPDHEDNNIIVAPADGTIVVIEEVMENEYLHEKRLQVSIFMSLFNAHVNWVPCEGKIVHLSHQNGRFWAAYLPKSSTENERSTIVIERSDGEQILVRQIAGAVAKRIATYVKTGQDCRINQQLGFIKFGSRVDLFLPLHTKVEVQPGDSVKGNRTVIAQS